MNEYFTINERLNSVFAANLTKEHAEYLKSRQIFDHETFSLGSAPSHQEITKLFTEAELSTVGLLSENTKHFLLAGRLVMPILSLKGAILGFSGRSLEPNAYAKYSNTRSNSYFKKKEHFFGIYQALPTVLERKRIIVTEGNLDCIMMHQCRFQETVALCGTALTEYHTFFLKLLGVNVILMMDGDAAGQKSANRSLRLLNQEQVKANIVRLPDNEDPASLLAKHQWAWLKKEIECTSLKFSQTQ